MADRNGEDRLAAFRVDDRDVVTKAIGDVKQLLVPRQRDAPGALADQNVALDCARRHIDHRHMGRVAERDVGGPAILRHGKADRSDVALSHSRRQKFNLASDRKRVEIDDIDFARQLRCDPELLAVRRCRKPSRPGADHDVARDVPAHRIDLVDEIANLGRHINDLAILADGDALRLGAGRHLLNDDVLIDIDDGERRRLLVRHIDPPLGLVDGKGLRARAGRQLAHNLKLRHVDDIDDVVIAAGDVELVVGRVEMHVPRAPRRLDVLDHLMRLGIDHNQIVRLLIADEDEARVLGMAGR